MQGRRTRVRRGGRYGTGRATASARRAAGSVRPGASLRRPRRRSTGRRRRRRRWRAACGRAACGRRSRSSWRAASICGGNTHRPARPRLPWAPPGRSYCEATRRAGRGWTHGPVCGLSPVGIAAARPSSRAGIRGSPPATGWPATPAPKAASAGARDEGAAGRSVGPTP